MPGAHALRQLRLHAHARSAISWPGGLGSALIFLREAPLQQPPVLDALAPAAPVSQAYTRSIAYDPEGAYIASVNKPGRS